MATITRKASSIKEAQEILSKAYEADRSSVYSNGRKSVHGSALTATLKEDNVEISSVYYTEYSLNQMFNL